MDTLAHYLKEVEEHLVAHGEGEKEREAGRM